MKKQENKGLFLILAILLIAGGLWYYEHYVNNKPIEKKQTDVTGEVSEVKKDYSIINKEVVEGSNVKINYPTFGVEQVDSDIKKYVDSRLKDYKDSLIAAGEVQTIDISYDIERYSREVISIKFNILYGGGARPVEDIDCLTYNLDEAKQIKLSDVFKANSSYLNKLSDIAYESLSKNADTESVKEGTSPEEKNFERFILTKESIIFYFPPCSVDACASGLKEVKISLTDLNLFLTSNFSKLSEEKVVAMGVIVNSIKPNSVILSPLEVSGSVNGSHWIGSNGIVGRVELIDGEKKVISSSSMNAITDQAKMPINFKANISFIKPESELGELVFYNENPSGVESFNETYRIKIRFK